MKYRVTYKRLSDVAVGKTGGPTMIIVDDCIEAESFEIGQDGTLVFGDHGQPFMALPPTFWSLVEPWDRTFATPTKPSIIT